MTSGVVQADLPVEPPPPETDTERLDRLGQEVVELRTMVSGLSRVLEGFVIQSQVAAAMPSIKAQLEASIQQKIASEGLLGMLSGTQSG